MNYGDVTIMAWSGEGKETITHCFALSFRNSIPGIGRASSHGHAIKFFPPIWSTVVPPKSSTFSKLSAEWWDPNGKMARCTDQPVAA